VEAASATPTPTRKQWRGLSVDAVLHMPLAVGQRWENVVSWYVERISADPGGLHVALSSMAIDVEVPSDADADAVRAALAPLVTALNKWQIPYSATISTNASRPVCCGIPLLQALAARRDSDVIGDATQRLVLYVGTVRGTQLVQDGLMTHMFDKWKSVVSVFANDTLSVDRAVWLSLVSGNGPYDVWWARQSYLRLLTDPTATTARAADWSVRTRKRIRAASTQLHRRNETAALAQGADECDGRLGAGECEDTHGGIRTKKQADKWSPCDGSTSGCLAGARFVWDVCKGAPALGSPKWDNCIITPPLRFEPVR
jgi:hypothetical protein